MISKIKRTERKLERLGFRKSVRNCFYGAQALGCNLIVDAVKRGSIDIRPVKPNTIAKSTRHRESSCC